MSCKMASTICCFLTTYSRSQTAFLPLIAPPFHGGSLSTNAFQKLLQEHPQTGSGRVEGKREGVVGTCRAYVARNTVACAATFLASYRSEHSTWIDGCAQPVEGIPWRLRFLISQAMQPLLWLQQLLQGGRTKVLGMWCVVLMVATPQM